VLVCTSCHGDDLAGGVVVDDAAHGLVWAPNLTTLEATPETWQRALLEGVGTSGTPMLWKGPGRYAGLRHEDLEEVVGFLSGLAAVERSVPEPSLAALYRIRRGLTSMPVYEAPQVAGDLAAAPDADWGAYVARLAGCVECHGGPSELPESLHGPALGGLDGWTGAQFADAVQEGVLPDGASLATARWHAYGRLNPLELDALWAWVRADRMGDDGVTSQ
jgi:cytochrome c553